MFVSARKLVDIALVACLAYPTAQCAFGQVVRPAPVPGQALPPGGQVIPGRPAGGFDRNLAQDQNQILQGSVIIGAPVMLQGGASWGTLRDFVISNNGCIESAVIAADNGFVLVPWTYGMFDFGRRAFVLDIGRDRIRDLPRLRDMAELRDPRFRQQHEAFFRGDQNMRGARDQRGFENRPDQRGVDNRPEMRQRGFDNQPGNRGTAPTTPGARSTGNGRPANPPAGENRGNENRGNERRER